MQIRLWALAAAICLAAGCSGGEGETTGTGGVTETDAAKSAPGSSTPSAMPGGGAEMAGGDMPGTSSPNTPDGGMTPPGMSPPTGTAADMYPGGMIPDGAYPGAGGNQQPQFSERPEDVADWKIDDFKKAAEERDPKLLSAIEAFGKTSRGNPEVAAQLSALLQVVGSLPALPTPPPGPPPGGAGGYPGGTPTFPGSVPPGSTENPGASELPGASGLPEGGAGDPRSAVDPLNSPIENAVGMRIPAGGNAVATRSLLLAQVLMSYGGQNQSQPPNSSQAFPGSGTGAPQPLGSGQPANSGSNPAGLPGAEGDVYPEGYPGTPPGGYPGAPGAGYNPPPRPGLSKDALVKAILRALANNDTPEAWTTIERCIKGEIKTGIKDDELVDFLLGLVMQSYGGKEHPTHAILTKALHSPQDLRAEGAPLDLTADDIQRRAVRLHVKYAAGALDTLLGVVIPGEIETPPPAPPQLAQYPPGTQPPNGPPGSGAFSPEQYPQGLPGAQPGVTGADIAAPIGAIPPGGAVPPDASIPPGGIAYPGGAYPGAPGTPPAAAPKPPAEKPKPKRDKSLALEPDELESVVKYLWDPEFLGLVNSHLQAVGRLGYDYEFMTLAAALPVPEVRNEMANLLQSHWQEGADSLSTLGFFEKVAMDPGLIVVMKNQPRERERVGRSQRPNDQPSPETVAKNSWMKAGEHTLRSMNERLHDAAIKVGRTDGLNGEAPVPLHFQAKVVADYSLNWPADLQQRIPEANPEFMRVRYIRIEQKGAITVANRHYGRQLKDAQRHVMPGVIWYDLLTDGSDRDKQRSVDVLLTDVKDEQRYIVEVLEVEIPKLEVSE